MSHPTPRRGHAAIGAIIQEIAPYLPSSTINRPGYTHCLTTYGLLTTTYARTADSPTPEKCYTEMQNLERDLRRRLDGLNAAKGVPAPMTACLDELRAALEDAVARGVDVEFVIRGMQSLLAEEPGAMPAPRPERVRMVPDTKVKKIWAELLEARERIKTLNEENNRLVLEVRRLEGERGQRRVKNGLEIRGCDDCAVDGSDWVQAAFVV